MSGWVLSSSADNGEPIKYDFKATKLVPKEMVTVSIYNNIQEPKLKFFNKTPYVFLANVHQEAKLICIKYKKAKVQGILEILAAELKLFICSAAMQTLVTVIKPCL